jgi:hypothetical protein
MEMVNHRRLIVSLISGAVLGILCVVGVGLRVGTAGTKLFLLAVWYNRLIMGLVIGLAGGLTLVEGPANSYLRGAVLGVVVSLAVFLSTEMRDVPSFLAGIVYGLIIEYVAARYA